MPVFARDATIGGGGPIAPGVESMSKKRSPAPPPEPGKRRGRPKLEEPKGRNPIVLNVRGGPEHAAWLDEIQAALAVEVGVPQVDRAFVYDRAMAALAKEMGRPAPARRY